jgi:hypothetical protein
MCFAIGNCLCIRDVGNFSLSLVFLCFSISHVMRNVSTPSISRYACTKVGTRTMKIGEHEQKKTFVEQLKGKAFSLRAGTLSTWMVPR